MSTPKILAQIEVLIDSQANILVTTGTGEGRFADFETQYKAQDRDLRAALRPLNIAPPFPWRSLWEWHGFYSQNLPTYAERRNHISGLSNAVQDEVETKQFSSIVSSQTPEFTSDVVRLALNEAEQQVSLGNPLPAVDRVHTAIHGHLRMLCLETDISVAEDASVTALMKAIRREHPQLEKSGVYGGEVSKVLNAMSSILNELNTIRNNGSMAHPNENLLGREEAMLAVNTGRSILAYIDSKLSDR